MRAGTENVPGIAGFGLAAKIIGGDLHHMPELLLLKQQLLDGLEQNQIKYLLNGPPIESAAPHVINISFPGRKGETMVHCLEAEGVYVSTGAACSSKKNQVSHVLTAIGRTEDEAEGSIRVSFSQLNDAKDVEKLVAALSHALNRIPLGTRR